MNDMKKQVQKEWVAACGVAAVWLAAGCASVKRETPPPASPDAPPVPTNTVAAAEAITHAPPTDGYTWEAVARLAAANCVEAKAVLLDAAAERYQTAVDTGWRNPQLRAGQLWGAEDETSPGRTGMRTYPNETDQPSRPFTSDRTWSDKEVDGENVGMRLYIANPFVNRWLRKRGEASARALEAKSDEVAYAVFCEVRMLCLEAEMLREEITLLEKMGALRVQIRDVRAEQAGAGVASPLDSIRAETKEAELRSEIHEKQTARQQLIRRIAVLAGLPAEQVKLRPRAFGQPVAEKVLDPAVLTDLAFMRRPDLARAEHEKEAAEHRVKAARAGQIPWFEYVDGTYKDLTEQSYGYEENVSGHDVTTQDETEWQIRVAVTLPVFNWLGDEVKLSRTQLAAAETRASGLYKTVREEVVGVLEDYRSACAVRDRLAGERDRLCETMTARIDALEQEPAVKREDVLMAREELIAYRRIGLKAERECLRMEQYLETVSGGSLTTER
jgi:outer membrane protein TolC